MRTNAHSLDQYHVAHVKEFCDNPKLANIAVTVHAASMGEESVFYPAQDVTLYGPAIAKLHELLNSLPTA